MIDRLLRNSILLLFHFWLLVTPFIFTSINDELFEFNKMLVTYAVAIAIATAWLSRLILQKKLHWKHSLLTWPIGLYVLSHILATAFSIHPHTSIFGYYSRFHGGLLSTLTYATLFFAFINTAHWKDIPHLIRTSLLATVGVCLYAIPEHFGVSPSCILITGEFSVHCWVQDVQTRVFATFGQPNWLAAYLLMMIPLAWWHGIVAWGKWQQRTSQLIQTAQPTIVNHLPPLLDLFLGISAIFMSVLTILYTRSRSGFIALALELAFLLAAGMWWYFFLRPKQTANTQETSLLLPLFGTLVGSGLLIAIVGSPLSPSIGTLINRATQTWQQEQSESALSTESEVAPTPLPTSDPTPASGTVLENGGTDSGKIRRIVWEGALRIWRRYPLFGSGLETFAYSYYLDRPAEHNAVSEWDFLYNRAHNEFLNILATSGSVGFIATLLLMGAFVLGVLRDLLSLAKHQTENTEKSTRTPDVSHLAPFFLLIALLAGYGGLAVSNFFGFSTVVVGTLFFLYKAWWVTFRESWATPNETVSKDSENQEEPTKTNGRSAKKNTSQRSYVKAEKTSSASRYTVAKNAENLDDIPGDERWLGVFGIVIIGLLLLMQVWGMWRNDILLARAKSHLAQGSGLAAYTTMQQLIRRAPLESIYVDQHSVTLARLAAGTYPQDATTGAQLAEEAITASDVAIQLNPVHLNLWKNRVRVFLLLAGIDPTNYTRALEALEQARALAPTDVKLVYNTALVLEALEETERARASYQTTLEMKPDYEAARNSYAQFLTSQGEYQAAIEQYEYVLEYLNPTAPTASQQLAELQALTATMSAETLQK